MDQEELLSRMKVRCAMVAESGTLAMRGRTGEAGAQVESSLALELESLRAPRELEATLRPMQAIVSTQLFCKMDQICDIMNLA